MQDKKIKQLKERLNLTKQKREKYNTIHGEASLKVTKYRNMKDDIHKTLEQADAGL